MRVSIEHSRSEVVKLVEVSSYLANIIVNNLDEYCNWLRTAGIFTPKTSVDWAGGELVIRQKRIKENYLKPEKLLEVLCKLGFGKFGIDSSPNNFMGSKHPILVDFYPFLIRDRKALKEQFQYSLDLVFARYFTLENVITTYIVRLFKERDKDALGVLQKANNILLDNYDLILPREKKRLLYALRTSRQGKIHAFTKFYKKTKTNNELPPLEDNDLKAQLSSLKRIQE